MLPLPAAGAGATGDTTMSSTQHQLIEQCATRLRGIVEALDNIHDTSPQRWSTDLDDVHSSAESLLAMIKDQAPTQAAQDLALRTIAEYPCPEQDGCPPVNYGMDGSREHSGRPQAVPDPQRSSRRPGARADQFGIPVVQMDRKQRHLGNRLRPDLELR